MYVYIYIYLFICVFIAMLNFFPHASGDKNREGYEDIREAIFSYTRAKNNNTHAHTRANFFRIASEAHNTGVPGMVYVLT